MLERLQAGPSTKVEMEDLLAEALTEASKPYVEEHATRMLEQLELLRLIVALPNAPAE